MYLKKEAIKLINFGFHLAPVFGVKKEGRCYCGNRHCYLVGKHLFNLTDRSYGTSCIKELSSKMRFHKHGNIAVQTGIRSSLVIIDVDTPAFKNGSFETLLRIAPEIDNTFTVETGSGGRHFYFKTTKKFKTGINKLGRNIDLLAEGGYAISVGSIHKNGQPYKLLKDDNILNFPKKLIQLLDDKITHAQMAFKTS